jgi:hypothetical protein
MEKTGESQPRCVTLAPTVPVPSRPFSLGRGCRGPRSGARASGLLGWGPVGPCLRLVVGALLGPACACFWAWAGALLNAFLWVLDTSNGVGCSHLAFRKFGRISDVWQSENLEGQPIYLGTFAWL